MPATLRGRLSAASGEAAITEGGPPVDGHLHRPGDDVPDFFTGMGVPARLHADRDLGEHLHDVPPRDRRLAVLDLGAFELAGKRVARWLRAGSRIRHEDLLE
jgi:hypothetical protein